MKQKIMAILLLPVLFAATTLVGAQTGGHFDLSWTTLDAGGGGSSGGAFTLHGTIGQQDMETLATGNFTLKGGFWQCLTPAVGSPIAAASGSNVQLSWTSGFPTANVYRATNDPYFEPTAAYANGVGSGWSDTGAAGDAANNYTYIIRAINGCGESDNSQRLGEFDFEVEPGGP